MFIRQEYISSVKRENKIDLLYVTVLKRSGLPIDSNCLKKEKEAKVFKRCPGRRLCLPRIN